MRRTVGAVLLGASLLAALACSKAPAEVITISALRVTPPGPGECAGRLEVTVTNGFWAPVRVGSLLVRQDGKRRDSLGERYPVGGRNSFDREDPAFATFDVYPTAGARAESDRQLAPGASRTLRVGILRVRTGGDVPSVSIQGKVFCTPPATSPPGELEETAVDLVTPPVVVDPGKWPLPSRLDSPALERAEAEGRTVSIAFEEAHLPHGGWYSLLIGSDGGALAGSSESGLRDGANRGAGPIPPDRQARLRSRLRSSSFRDFHVGPGFIEDGHPVRLLIVMGSAAFVGDAQDEEFVASGLGPLLEDLRGIREGLPEAR